MPTFPMRGPGGTSTSSDHEPRIVVIVPSPTAYGQVADKQGLIDSDPSTDLVDLARDIHSYVCEAGLGHLGVGQRLARLLRDCSNRNELDFEERLFIQWLRIEWADILNDPGPRYGVDPRVRASADRTIGGAK